MSQPVQSTPDAADSARRASEMQKESAISRHAESCRFIRHRFAAARIASLACALLVTMSSISFAQQELPEPTISALELPPEIAFQLGMMRFQNEQYTEAQALLHRARSSHAAAAYYEGIAAMQLEQFADAVEAFDSISRDEILPASFDYDFGIALVEAGEIARGIERLEFFAAHHSGDLNVDEELAEARSRLEYPLEQVSGEDVGIATLEQTEFEIYEPSEAELALACEPICEPRPWNLTVLNAIDWDSNVILLPDFGGLGSDRDHTDVRHVSAVYGDYRWKEEHDCVMGVTGSLSKSTYFDLDDFNLFEASAGVYGNKALSEAVLIGANYQYHHSLVEGSTLTSEHRAVLNGSLLEGDFGHLTTYYEYDRNRINAPALIPAQQRTANVHALGVTQAIYWLGGRGRLFAGYRFSLNHARGSDFEYQSNMVNGRIEFPILSDRWLWTNTIVDADARVFFDRYDNPNSLDFDGDERSDNRVEVRVGSQKYFTDHFSVRLDYTYVNSDSNVANLFGVRFYDYTRHVISSQFIYDF